MPILLALAACGGSEMARPLVLAHRGAPGYLPDHTLEGYTLAISQGADYIEPDLVSTKDHVLVARHENELSKTTDVAAKFPERRTAKVVDGQTIEGWFVEDLTLAELRTLRAVQPLPGRPHDQDGKFTIPTFDEILDLAIAKGRERGRPVGVEPETKHPSYFAALGLPLEAPMLASLEARSLARANAPVFVQSFERGNLEALRASTALKLVALIDEPGSRLTPEGLRDIATYAHGIGVHKSAIVGDDGQATAVVADAHAAGLFVHVYTFRDEPESVAPWAQGDPVAELSRFYALGVDGVFADFPDTAVRARPR